MLNKDMWYKSAPIAIRATEDACCTNAGAKKNKHATQLDI